MNREALERYQVIVYLVAIIAGLGVGTSLPHEQSFFETLLWPVLGVLLFTIFTQVKLTNLVSVLSHRRLFLSALIGNFAIIPLFVWILLQFLPDILPIKLGVAMVLLVPCTDWFITFTHLGKGDTESAIAFAPVSLLVQMILLPGFLLLFFGEELVVSAAHVELLYVFVFIIGVPLFAAYLTQKLVTSKPTLTGLLQTLAWFPVPLLALVVFLVATSQVTALLDAGKFLWQPIIIYVAFLFGALVLAWALSYVFKLPASHGRVLAFSFGSRNSFVVLPLALALPVSFELASIVIVFQILVELVGMVLFVWIVPERLFP